MRQTLGVLVALSLLIAPIVSTAMDMHELSHGSQHLQMGHEVADPDHGDAPGGLYSILHGVHVCGHGVGILPSLVLLNLSGEATPPPPLQDVPRDSAGPELLFRPPRP